MFGCSKEKTGWKRLRVLASALLAVGVVAFAPSAQAVPSSIGVNMFLHSADQHAFADAMKTAKPSWGTVSDFNAPTTNVDANGWPTADASILIMYGSSGENGTYRLVFNGQADLSTWFDIIAFSNQTYDAASNTTTATAQIRNAPGVIAAARFTNTRRTAGSALNTGVTNVRFYRPTVAGGTTPYDPSVTFTTPIKIAASRYTHLRFMPGTNNNISSNWSDRTRPLQPQTYYPPGGDGFEGNGLAWEYQVQFANETNKDLWICVPAKATDDYILKLAQLMRYGSDGTLPYTSTQSNPVFPPLKSTLKLYIEYSNEVWNATFGQFGINLNLAKAEVAAGNSPLNYDGATGDFTWARRRVATQAVKISKTFRSVFGDSQMMTRVRPIMMWQYNNLQETASYQLDMLSNYFNNADGVQHVTDPHPPSYYLYGGGGSPYYGDNLPNSVNNDPSTTVDQIFASGLESGYAVITQEVVDWAKYYGLKSVNYEGGMSVGGDGMTNSARAARQDPRAKQWEFDAYDIWARAGGDVFTYGTYAQWDTPENEASSPLQQGVTEILNGTHVTPAVDRGVLVPQNVVPYERDFYDVGTSADHLVVRTDNPGNYNMVIRYGGSGTNIFSVVVNGTRVSPPSGTVFPAANYPDGTVTVPVTLDQGQNGILMYYVSGGRMHFGPTITFTTTGGPPTPTPTPPPGASLQNGSFETPSLGGGAYVYNTPNATWTFAGNSGIQSNGSAWGAANAPDGTQTAFLQGINGSNGNITQTFGWTGGSTTVSFKAAQRNNGGVNNQGVRVLVDGALVSTITPSGTAFTIYTTSAFNVTAGNHTLKFEGNSATGDNNAFIDQVSIGAGGGTPTGSGSITRDVWTGISGTSVSNIPVTTTPSSTSTLTSFEAPTDVADNYGQRARGYLTAPATGSYTFWIAGDDNCELYLSTNNQPSGKVKIAQVTTWTNSREWTREAGQKSAAINLVAGQQYYVEALMKEGGGGDNLAVGWAKPGQATTAPSEVIPGSALSPFSGGSASAKLSGTVIGTPGSWSGTSSDDKAKAFDGLFSTAFDSPQQSNAWVGLDLGSVKTLTQVKYAPRNTLASRMVGGKFQGSSSADFSSSVVDLFTIGSAPAENVLATQNVSGTYRYIRYFSPLASWGNVSELEFWGN